ncbi:MAG: dTDP-4-dehydrorhamnose 3,5-epimerase family protein [Bacteroidota bacterium]|nr:dTDP-4-dehydrorhamnose 3,5-epimerase family protein [Candidatus Kapabacteria bacterium]MDW8219711.1 dTDP-4-dehydrorhamnose 3,5-epimerase family protein [Bacteroidota bacterium]
MMVQDITIPFLQSIPYVRCSTAQGATIQGVYYRALKAIVDGRGDVIELWSLPWVERENIIVPQHVYQSATDYGVVKAWHLHALHTDQFTVTRGKMQIVCVDVRSSSPTFGQVNSFIIGVQNPAMILIPPGVMHGWKALSQPETIVINLQSHPYDPSDEFKFAWDCVLQDVWEPKFG